MGYRAKNVRRLLPIVAAPCVGAGLVVAAFVVEGGPVSHLTRPLVVVTVVAVLVGAVSALLNRRIGSPVLVSMLVTALVVDPDSPVVLGLAIVACGVVVWHLLKGVVVEVDKPLLAAGAVFLVAGLIQVVPMLSWSAPALASDVDEPPTFLILLDGYPRADTLAELGIDVSGFIEKLDRRGFDHYPDATSHHFWTFRTLTAMTTGEPMAASGWGTPAERKAARSSWRLPDGFAYVAPPFGDISFPDVQPLNPIAITRVETDLLAESALGTFAGELVMDGLRSHLDESLAALTATNETLVFAHLLAPHTPFLYGADGEPLEAPGCWPGCNIFGVDLAAMDMSLDNWVAGTSGYLEWLNDRLIDTVDRILARHSEARIVLFSDHGGRFSLDRPSEWRRIFLVARTPDDAGFFAESPHPSSVFSLLSE